MPDNIKSILDNIIEITPFLCTIGGKPSLNTSRILETLVTFIGTGVIAAFVTSYVMLQVLEVKFIYMEKSLTEKIESNKERILDNKDRINKNCNFKNIEIT